VRGVSPSDGPTREKDSYEQGKQFLSHQGDSGFGRQRIARGSGWRPAHIVTPVGNTNKRPVTSLDDLSSTRTMSPQSRGNCSSI